MANEKKYKFNFKNKNTNFLYQSIIQQYIDQYGIDCYYIPLNKYPSGQISDVLQEVVERNYTKVYKLRMLLEDALLLQGQGDIFSKFGLDIQDEITLYISRKEIIERFTGEVIDISPGTSNISVKDYDTNETKPKIADLIWVPFWNSLFKISFVEDQENKISQFNSAYKLVMKKYHPSTSEIIDISETGIGNPLETGATIDIEEINKINAIDDVNENNQNVEMDPDESGFDPLNTDILNDDIKRDADELTNTDPDDIFESWL